MKMRKGFVSNSSSSSFCIIGTRMHVDKLGLAEKFDSDEIEYGVFEGKLINFYGCDYDINDFTAGIEAERLLDKMTIPEAKKHFRDLVKQNFNIDIPISQIEFSFGSCGNG